MISTKSPQDRTAAHFAAFAAIVSVILGLLVLLALLEASSAWAVDKHQYDPVLSLTGSTSVSAEDPAPDPAPNHPAKGFETPCGVATDPHGYIYVVSPANASTNGRIDIFDAAGNYLTEIHDEYEPCSLAVDSEGNIYVVEITSHGDGFGPRDVQRYAPTSYPPTSASGYTLAKSFEFTDENGSDFCSRPNSVAVDPSNDHLYIGHGCRVEEYGSAAEGSSLIDEEAVVRPESGYAFTSAVVYGANQDVYAAALHNGGAPSEVDKVYVFDGATGDVKCELEGAQIPEKNFEEFAFGLGATLGVDQANGDFYVYNISKGSVDQFAVNGENCGYLGRLPQNPPTLKGFAPGGAIAIDDPLEEAESGYESPNEGYVYVTSGKSAASSHLFAFKPRIGGPPEIRNQTVSAATETEAVLMAELDPDGFETKYHFQVTTQAALREHGYEGATTVPASDASVAAGGAFVRVAEPITGLQPGTAYSFRLVASNCEAKEADPEDCLTAGEGKPGQEGDDARFATYPTPSPAGPCPNSALRTGLSAALPDCRAYELTTPPDTQGHVPTMATLGEGFGGIGFDTTMASPDGNSLVFGSKSGALPGIGGGGFQDTYEAHRDGSGWQSRFTGVSAAQGAVVRVGGLTSDHRYSFWNVVGDHGSLANPLPFPEGGEAGYLRVPADSPAPSPNCAPAAEPEGQFELIGCGSFGLERRAQGKWISPGGGHVIVVTTTNNGAPGRQLEPCAPPTPSSAIYDRTPGGVTRCVSLLPGATTSEKDATYRGVSADGSAVAFTVGGDGNLYVRRDDTETFIAAGGSPTFGGLSADGSHVFYVSGGNVFVCDLDEGSCAGAGAHAPTPIGSGGESTLVNVSADGSHVYFVSKKALTGGEKNELEVKAKAGAENLYAWDGAALRFVAILDPLDVSGESGFGGLGLWTSAAFITATNSGPANDPSRTTPDGTVMVFESHADLTEYHSGGRREIYRYEAGAVSGQRLICLSCNPTGAPAASDARLESRPPGSVFDFSPPVNSLTHIANVTIDGKRVFFQSADRLVRADTDGRQDVYEWEAQGAGGCKRNVGCLSLISGGRSSEDDYLYAMTPDGHDVFFLSGDALVPRDLDKTPSIYDARVEGGVPAPVPPASECLGEVCQPAVAAPDSPTPASFGFEGVGNVRKKNAHKPRCGKAGRRVKVKGKVRCVKNRSKKKQQSKNHRRNINRWIAQ
jgi:DNA-binding beta-propeller fold protein YncE